MRRPPARRTVLFAAVLAGACADPPSGPAVSVTDSAGVRVVAHGAGAAEAADRWVLSPEPAVEIGGGPEADPPLYRVGPVRPLPGGRVAVGTSRPPRALVLREDGALEATLGGPGEGPGEFHEVASVVPLGGDSLAVWDPNRRRLSVFGGDGRFAREVALGLLAPLSPMAAGSTEVPAGLTRLIPLGPRSMALFAVGVWGPRSDEPGVLRTEMPSHRIDADGSARARYGPFPGMELYWSPRTTMAPYPFGATTDAAASAGALVVGTADAPEIRFYDPDGALAQVVRWDGGDRGLADSPRVAEYEAWLDAQLGEMEPREAEFLRGILDAVPRPERLPAYDGLLGDGDTGDVWVGEYPGQLGLLGISPDVRRTPPRRWLVFGADGSLRATIATPEGFDPRAVRGGRVWGVFTDALDVESVRAYRIVRP